MSPSSPRTSGARLPSSTRRASSRSAVRTEVRTTSMGTLGRGGRSLEGVLHVPSQRVECHKVGVRYVSLELGDRVVELADLDELPFTQTFDHLLERVEEVLELVS